MAVGQLYEKGLQYNTLGTYRSTISAFHTGFNGISVGEHPKVKKLMRGVNNIRPPQPKYTVIWEVDQVLQTIKTLYPNDTLTPKLLTEKTCALLGLIAIPRGCELSYMDTKLMGKGRNLYSFSFNKNFKASKQGKRAKDLYIHEFEEDISICPVRTLDAYIQMTKPWRDSNGETQLFLSYIMPHEGIKKCTIAKWVKNLLKLANIDTSFYQAHSFRSVSSSRAKTQGLSLEDILKRRNWSRSSTWEKFYHRPTRSPSQEYQLSILRPQKD